MPTSCCAPGCTHRFAKNSGIHFYRFPKEKERKLKWQRALQRRDISDPLKFWEPSDHDRLCSQHFTTGKPSMDPCHPDYTPSVFIFTPVTKRTPAREERFQRVKRRRLVLTPIAEKENRNDDAVLTPITEKENRNDDAAAVAEALLHLGQDLPQSCDKGTDPGPDLLRNEHETLQANYRSLQQEYQRVLDENRDLKDKIAKEKFTFQNLTNSKIRSLTGVPTMAVFIWVLTLISGVVKPIGKLCRGDMLLLVLMKLRLNLTNTDLAMRFSICPTEVSRVLCQCLPKIAMRLRFLLKWPTISVIMKNMPRSFKRNYKKCRVIIDCSEVFIQRPSNLSARAKTWSNYKHHNTLKFLIGITPYGAVSFLSKCWGGRVSDKEITEKSGFYDKLEPGDLVMADRGFLISDELTAHGASLAIPPFSKGKTQFSQKEVECARRLSKSRIHVERAIERVKRFQILKNTMQISLVRHADSILTICASLTNLLPKLVK